MNRVVKILMERDDMSLEEATGLVQETADAILECDCTLDADNIIMDNLGLEPDYIFDILNI